jgi:hypothetical protein
MALVIYQKSFLLGLKRILLASHFHIVLIDGGYCTNILYTYSQRHYSMSIKQFLQII